MQGMRGLCNYLRLDFFRLQWQPQQQTRKMGANCGCSHPNESHPQHLYVLVPLVEGGRLERLSLHLQLQQLCSGFADLCCPHFIFEPMTFDILLSLSEIKQLLYLVIQSVFGFTDGVIQHDSVLHQTCNFSWNQSIIEIYLSLLIAKQSRSMTDEVMLLRCYPNQIEAQAWIQDPGLLATAL